MANKKEMTYEIELEGKESGKGFGFEIDESAAAQFVSDNDDIYEEYEKLYPEPKNAWVWEGVFELLEKYEDRAKKYFQDYYSEELEELEEEYYKDLAEEYRGGYYDED